MPLRCERLEPPMSQMGQNRVRSTSESGRQTRQPASRLRATSGLMHRRKCVGLLNHLVGNGDQGWGDFKAKHLRSL
jgi:hypothetical protein